MHSHKIKNLAPYLCIFGGFSCIFLHISGLLQHILKKLRKPKYPVNKSVPLRASAVADFTFSFRNNKLTLLMQDSIGGNAKTLMFVNISPSSFNLDETIVSLTYATRVKQVTNGATRNAESKEVARLRSVSSPSSSRPC
jgi:hypothetical protein